MKFWLKIEEAAEFLLGIVLFAYLDIAWWFPLLLFTPDISMLGYAFNSKIGYWCYNIAHHKGIAISCFLLGLWLDVLPLALAGSILLAHAALDRLLGYGLKYPDSFYQTHLGRIDK